MGGNVENWSVSPSSLRYGSLATSGNAITATRSGANTQIYRDLGATIGGAGSDVWLSMLIQGPADAFAGLSLFNGNSEIAFIGTSFGGNATRLIGGSAMAGGLATLGTSTGDAEVHMMVMRFDMSTAVPTYTLWVDPDLSSLGEGAAPTVTDGGMVKSFNTGTQAFEFDRIRLGMFTNDQTMVLDEVRVGESWEDVAPIPEPATFGMLGLGALIMLGFRRIKA